jgi:choline/glycine/proline betaine transport protein
MHRAPSYYGVAEPVDHFLRPPEGEAGTIQAARNAMTYSFYHPPSHALALQKLGKAPSEVLMASFV